MTSAHSPLPHPVPILDGRIISAKPPISSLSVCSAKTPFLLPALHA